MQVTAQGILLDVEGTTSAVAYVYDEMFPFARKHMRAYIGRNWHNKSFAQVVEQLAADANDKDANFSPDMLAAAAERLMDADVKATGLKQLQGLVWEAGFRSGALVAHVYDDVAPQLKAWHQAGLGIRIYSSGSVHSQRLFFGHTVAGDLLPLVEGHYDTTTGPKREAESYRIIASDWGLAAEQIIFLSDIPQELAAAGEAGMKVALVNRPGNASVDDHDFPVINSFDELNVTRPSRAGGNSDTTRQI